jgi:CBS domain-containing protein
MAATLAPPPAMHSAPSYGAQHRLKSIRVAVVYSTPWLGAGISPAAAPVQVVARVCTTQRGRAAVLSSHAFRFGGAESWPMDWALPTLEDVGHFFQQHVLKQQVSESAILDDVMSRQIICVTTGVSLSSLVNTLKKVSGVCVVDDERRLIGIVSRADVRDKQGVRNLSSSYT